MKTMILLNESEWAASLLTEKSMGEHPSDTLRIISRYYIDRGMPKRAVIDAVRNFVIRCDPSAVMKNWEQLIEKSYHRAEKQPAIDIDYIPVTQSELDTIASLSGVQIRRVAFTLLCLAKYWRLRSPDTDYWVCTRDRDVFKMANVQTSIKRQCLMYHEMKECGLLRLPRKVDGKNVRVCFADENGADVMQISDFRNLGYQYLRYIGEPFYACENCGILSKVPNPKQRHKPKYCKECAAQIKIQQTVNAAMRRKEKNAEINVNMLKN